MIPDPNPRAWDVFFERKNPYWVIVHLKDGRRIGGLYAENSIASSNPATPEIYLEQVWKLGQEGQFESLIDQTGGILILGDEILALEFYDMIKEGD